MLFAYALLFIVLYFIFFERKESFTQEEEVIISGLVGQGKLTSDATENQKRLALRMFRQGL
jgi:hypothetical protein